MQCKITTVYSRITDWIRKGPVRRLFCQHNRLSSIWVYNFVIFILIYLIRFDRNARWLIKLIIEIWWRWRLSPIYAIYIYIYLKLSAPILDYIIIRYWIVSNNILLYLCLYTTYRGLAKLWFALPDLGRQWISLI